MKLHSIRRSLPTLAVFGLALGGQTTIATSASNELENPKLGIQRCSTALVGTHNPGLVAQKDILICFDGFVSSFDSDDDDDGDGKRDTLGVPHWVAHRVREWSKPAGESSKRPSRWLTVPQLKKKGIAPTHDSYVYSRRFRSSHPNWYERGHLAQKYLVERIDHVRRPPDGKGAAYFTHNVVNAVPQLGVFNRGAWLDLECRSGAWANHFKEVWIVIGPVFLTGRPNGWLRERGRQVMRVAIPDAIFKIVARKVARRAGGARWDALAFIYPQHHPDYGKREWNALNWITSIARVEQLTGLTFFPGEPGSGPNKTRVPAKLWRHDKTDFDPGCKRFAR